METEARTTTPAAVGEPLGHEAGVGDRIEPGRVIMTPAVTTTHDPFASFAERDGEADRTAYTGF